MNEEESIALIRELSEIAKQEGDVSKVAYKATMALSQYLLEVKTLRQYLFMLILIYGNKIKLDVKFLKRFENIEPAISVIPTRDGGAEIFAYCDEVYNQESEYPQ